MTNPQSLAEALYRLIAQSRNRQDLAQAVAAYLVAERRTKDVNAVMRKLEQLRLERDSIREVIATSARPLTNANKKAIKALFGQQYIILHEQHDPSLIGGVKVHAHDQQFDSSVRTRLQRLKAGI